MRKFYFLSLIAVGLLLSQYLFHPFDIGKYLVRTSTQTIVRIETVTSILTASETLYSTLTSPMLTTATLTYSVTSTMTQMITVPTTVPTTVLTTITQAVPSTVVTTILTTHSTTFTATYTSVYVVYESYPITFTTTRSITVTVPTLTTTSVITYVTTQTLPTTYTTTRTSTVTTTLFSSLTTSQTSTQTTSTAMTSTTTMTGARVPTRIVEFGSHPALGTHIYYWGRLIRTDISDAPGGSAGLERKAVRLTYAYRDKDNVLRYMSMDLLTRLATDGRLPYASSNRGEFDWTELTLRDPNGANVGLWITHDPGDGSGIRSMTIPSANTQGLIVEFLGDGTYAPCSYAPYPWPPELTVGVSVLFSPLCH